ncbi:uncharacterized protein V3H82_007926 [Fundulus diaphanus]
MDNSAANKNHVQCSTWLDHSGWSTAASQGLPMNLNSQTHSLGSDQRSLFGHLETAGQSSMSNPNRNNSLFKSANLNSIFSSSSLFHNSANTSAPQDMNFAPQTSYTPSGLPATNQAKMIPAAGLPQQNQGPPACAVQGLPAQQANYKMFQTQMPGHGLSHELQNHSFGVSSCGPNVSGSQATFGGQNNGGRYPNTFTSPTSTEQQQWVPSSSGGRAVSDVAARVNKEPSREKGFPPLTEADVKRSSILNQRAELLKQLENIDKLLETMPSDQSEEEEPSNNDVQEMDKSCSESEADADADGDAESDYVPQSEVSFSSSHSEDDAVPEDQVSHSDPSSPMNETIKEEENSDDSLSEEENLSSPQKTVENKKEKTGKVEVQVVKPKEGRCYGKLNYCLFCARPLTKMARHLTRVHSDRVEVAVAFQHPANSKERKDIWQKLINEGNFKHNRDVLKTGKGQLAVRMRRSLPSKPIDFVHCIYCHGLFRKKSMFIHMKRCRAKDEKKSKPQEGRKRIVSQCALLTKNCDGLGEDFKNLLSAMVYDEVSETVMGDSIMLQFGEQIFNEYNRDGKRHGYVRQTLRHVARLLLEAQKSTPLQSLEDFFEPSNFKHVVSAVKVLTGYDPEKKTYAKASLALKLGYHLKKICGIIESNAQSYGDTKAAECCKIFLSVYNKKWTRCITSCALSNIKDTQRKKAKEVPSVQDVKRLHYHLEKFHRAAEEKLRENVCVENFTALARAVLARTILFNRRLPGEVASITVADFESRVLSDVCDDMDVSISELERKLCGLFKRVNIRGSCGRTVPIILKPALESSMELLVNVREACGVFRDNPYVFARQLALTPQKGSQCLQLHAKKCGAEDPAALNVLKIRKHFTTLLQLINLDEEEVRQIFGPSSDIKELRQINDTMCDDSIMESEGPLKFYQQRRGANGCSTAAAGKKSRREALHSKAKLAWNEAEVHAVEKHLLSFIKNHKLPQKDDCVQCLEAEPRALRKRSWKGVKDYVRNRITTLQRQAGSSKESSKSGTRKAKPKQSSATSKPSDGGKEPREKPGPGPGPSSKSGPSKSQKGKARSDFRHKAKPKWDEAEVCAVEKHLMRFIEEHKLPHKDDCVRCLEAEPQALRNRSWKGVKDYVRNRITALQRQGVFFKDSSKPKSRSKQETSQSSGRFRSPNEQQTVPELLSVISSCSFGPSTLYQPQTYAATTSCDMRSPPKSGRSKGKASAGPHPKSKHSWNEAEVAAVEKHLMSFITKQKLPQKDDCVQCLNAEPHALRNCSWKGVKDYVRNRITTLQRQSGALKTPSKSSRSRKDKPQQSVGRYHQL